MRNKRESVIMGVLIVSVVVLSLFAYRILMNGDTYLGDEIKKQNSVDFCESQGWAYTTRYNADTKTIWCGSKMGKGFDGIVYNVEENFFGNLKLNDALGEQDE